MSYYSGNGQIFLNEDGYESTLSCVSKTKNDNSYPVKCQTLDKILGKYSKFRDVDLLTVDVEGHEREVLDALTNDKFKAKVIILESDKNQIKDLLKNDFLKIYRSVFINGVNTILINKYTKINEIETLPIGFKTCWTQ